MKELTQLRDMKTFIPLDLNNLTREDILKALSSLMVLAEKQYGTIKAIPCDYGSKKMRDDSYNKHDYASPTC